MPEPAAAPPTRSERRQHTNRVRVVAIVAVVVVLLVGAGVFAITQGGGGDASAKPAATNAATSSSAAPVGGPNVFADQGDQVFRVAVVKAIGIPIYTAPDANAKPAQTLSALTEYRVPRSLLVFNTYQDWLQVYLPTRPNNSTGWVKSSDVNVSPQTMDWAVKVDLEHFHVTVLHNGAVDWETDAAIGSPQYPTPTGTYYITDPIDLRNQPGTGYGAFALGLSGHSDVLTEFAGSDGQIGIHGTDNPGDIGQAISHGCVRLTNPDILRLSTLPIGTPVFIT